MPIPPSLAKALSKTSSGISYQTVLDGYAHKVAKNANMVQVNVIIGQEDTYQFLKDICGYTTWTAGAQVALSRTLPLQCPFSRSLYLDDAELINKGVIGKDGGAGLFAEGATNLADLSNENWPIWDWSMYRLTFTRPPFWIVSDAYLAAFYGNAEQWRYCQISQRFKPRMRKKPGFTYQYTDPVTSLVVPADEVGFNPDYQLEFLVTWTQVPIAAIPWTAIAAAFNTVNLNAFNPGITGSLNVAAPTSIWAAGTLMFKGVDNPISFYLGADGNWYADLMYVLSFQPGGWNFYRLNSMTSDMPPKYQYAAVTARPPAPVGTPPFASTDFQDLFTPAAS